MVSVRTVVAHDELHRDGEALVLLDGRVHRVSPVGTLIRARARAGATVEELATVLEAELGPPGDGTTLELTRQAVQALLEAGLLEAVAG